MSVKVALFSHNDAHNLIDTVNDFCKDKKVIDIKYQSMIAGCAINDRVLVIYEDQDGQEEGEEK
jgi:patatin-like phospholipase/acyl hydrolase